MRARTVLQSDERGLPIGAESVEGTEYDFRKPRRIDSTVLDHASYSYLMLFSGDPLPNVRRRSLAVEPMTCPPNAFRTGEALIRLEPGSSFTGTWGVARGNAVS